MLDTAPFSPAVLSLDEARALRSEQARLAEAHAQRVVELRARGRLREAAEANHAYRRSAHRCRLLGERIREEQLPLPVPARAA